MSSDHYNATIEQYAERIAELERKDFARVRVIHALHERINELMEQLDEARAVLRGMNAVVPEVSAYFRRRP